MKPSLKPRYLSKTLQLSTPRAYNILFISTGIAFACYLLVRLAAIFVVGPDPFGTVENNVIYSIQQMLQRRPLYQHPEQPPFSITQYSPIYYYIIYGLCRLTSVQAHDLISIYTISRICSLFFNFLFCGLIGVIAVHIFNTPKKTGILFFMLGFLTLQTQAFSRPDSLYNFSVLLTVFLYLDYLKKKKGAISYAGFALTAITAVFSIFSKQSGIILPMLLLGYHLFIVRSFKGTVIFGLMMAATLVFFIFIFGKPDLEVFYLNAVRGLDNSINLSLFWHHIILAYFCSVPGFVLTTTSLYTVLLLIRSNVKTESFLAWSVLALFSFALLTSTKDGSTPSYFAESGALALIGFYFIKDRISMPPAMLVISFLLLITALTMRPDVLIPINSKTKFQSTVYNKEYDVYRYISENDPPANGEYVFIEMPARTSFMTGIFYDKGLFPQKDIISQKLVFDYTEFYKLKKEGKIKYVVSKQKEVKYLDASFDEYTTEAVINGYYILKR
mgnify:CR=1 FL=1|jgi:hypothetical protein